MENVGRLNSYLGTLDVVRQTQTELREMADQCLMRLQHLSSRWESLKHRGGASCHAACAFGRRPLQLSSSTA